jgi:hypothetical protein
MAIENWEDVVHKDFPPRGEVTGSTIAMTTKWAKKGYSTGSVRMDTGRFLTDEEMTERRKEVYRPLP